MVGGGVSKIEWTEKTETPIKAKNLDTGLVGNYCQKVSPGCANCYAARLNQNTRFGGNKLAYKPNQPYEMVFNDMMVKNWERKRINKKIFVCSMTDWCGNFVPQRWRLAMLDSMAKSICTFQLLTKRPHELLRTVQYWLTLNNLEKLPPNIWVGVSVENQKTANKRIPILAKVPASVRFLSCEPLLEVIDLWGWLFDLEETVLHWVIVGGESAPGARPMPPEAALLIKDNCEESGTPFFFKQWGEWDLAGNRVGKKKAGRLLDGRTWDEFPRGANGKT